MLPARRNPHPGAQRSFRNHGRLIGNGVVVQSGAATAYEATGFGVAGDQAGEDQEAEGGDAAVGEFAGLEADLGKIFGGFAGFEGAAGGFPGGFGATKE